MTEPTCGTCRCFKPHTTVRDGIPADLALRPSALPLSGQCRLDPPIPDPGGYPRLPKDARRPKVDADDWCAQHQPAGSPT